MKRLILLAALIGCAADERPEIPAPELDAVEPAVREVVEQAIEAVLDGPADAERWGALGNRYRAQQWSLEAAECFAEAERLDPRRFDWPYLLGRSLQAHDPERAVEAYRRALAIDPDYPPAVLRHGETLAALGRIEDARAAFRRAGELDPTNPLPLLRLGQSAADAGRWKAARAAFEQALQRNPEDGRTHVGLARVLMALGDSEAARRHAEIGRVRLRKPATADPRGALSIEVAGSWGLAQRGRRLLASGRTEEAVAALREAVAATPDRFASRLNLGLALMTMGSPGEAEPHLERAVWLNPQSEIARSALGGALLARGAAAEATPHLREAVALDPGDARAHLLLGQALTLQGDAGAETVLERAIELAEASGDAPFIEAARRWLDRL